MDLEKTYEPSKHEAKIYKLWEDSGVFAPDKNPDKEPYCILMPPPNANADLHLGHALTSTLEDILIRHARMQGKAALFLPGADHAGFETQVVFEKKLASEGKSRFDFKRNELYDQIWDFVQANKTNMENQQRRIGSSCDWSRNTFTLDPHIIERAYQTFAKLWHDDLLYRGKRVVNYCTHHGTSFSDLEVQYQEKQSHLWYIDYPIAESEEKITVATTRPETMLGDAAIAVHPQDKRYQHLVGKLAILPLVNRKIPIITDEAIDQRFGTGAVKVTPAHDPLDFEISERHNLPLYQIIGTDGKITNEAPKVYQNLSVETARNKVLADLEKQALISKIVDYKHAVGHCYKCKHIIEPLVIDQWLIRMKPLAEKAISVLEAGAIKIVPTSKLKVIFGWLENIRDWNVSRQIAWGIPIPAFIAQDGTVIINLKEKSNKLVKNGQTYWRDPDTFDTWFSSGQWPFATLDYPNGADFKRFYPTSVMETAGEIIFFWVARMIMLGLYVTGEVPFKTVYLHGLVLDEHGKKMSKSRANVISPLHLIEKYGADALRMGIVAGRSAGMNQSFVEDRIVAYRNFCNKLWNSARYILAKVPANYIVNKPAPKTIADHWMLDVLSTKVKKVSRLIDGYRFAEAVEVIYALLWNDFADWYIESSKLDLNIDILVYSLETILKLTHPFAPFVTEAIWQKLPWQKDNLITADWPHPEYAFGDQAKSFRVIQQLVLDIRAGLKPDLTVSIAQSNQTLIEKLAGQNTSRDHSGAKAKQVKLLQTKIAYERLLEKELQNRQFVAHAPKELIQKKQQLLKSVKQEIVQIKNRLKNTESA